MLRTRFEHIPNEILFEICSYLKLSDLCFSFLNLNQRFNSIVYSSNFLSHTTQKNDELLQIFGKQIIQLSIATSYETIDLSRCPSLRSLTIHNATEAQLEQIQPSILSEIRRLSITATYSLANSKKLLQEILSNAYPSLRHFDVVGCSPRSINLKPGSACNLRSIQMAVNNVGIISSILMACPSLSYLEVRSYSNGADTPVITAVVNTSLETFMFYADPNKTRLSTVENLVECMPNLKRLHLQVCCSPSISDLARILKEHVRHLIQFTCYMMASMRPRREEGDPNWVRNLHRCFNDIRVSNKCYVYHVYTTYDESF